MTPASPASFPALKAVSCGACGWLEASAATECRSCGAGLSSTTISASPQHPVEPSPQPRQFQQHYEPVRDASVSRWPLWLGVGAIAFIAWQWAGQPVSHAPGVLIPEAPKQALVEKETPKWTRGETEFTPLATYEIKARVLHRERYRFDACSDLAPLDLGVGWSVMSDETNVQKCTFSNSGRYLTWSYGSDGPPPKASNCMSNMHMIPANDAVRSRLLDLKQGELFQANGYLVEVRRPGMNPWTSSLSRTDQGNGACEIMWVDRVISVR